MGFIILIITAPTSLLKQNHVFAHSDYVRQFIRLNQTILRPQSTAFCYNAKKKKGLNFKKGNVSVDVRKIFKFVYLNSKVRF